jgi:zinc protease
MKIVNMMLIILIAVVFTASMGQAQNVYKKQVLDNGLTVLIKSNPDSRVYAVNILAKGRCRLEPEGKTGIAEFVNRMLVKGTENYSAEELSKQLDKNGVNLTLHDNPYIPYDDRYTSRAFAFIKLETIDEFADGATGLLSEMVINPTFPEDKIQEVRSEIMGILGMNRGSTYKNAVDQFYRELFPGHPCSRTVLGDMRTIGSISRDDLVAFHSIFYAPENMILAVATNIPADDCLDMIEKYFSEMPPSGFDYSPIPEPRPVKGSVKAHTRMDKDQVYIYYGNIVPGPADPSYPAMVVATSALSTRLGLELREKQGLAYSVGAGLKSYPGFAVFYASMGTGYRNFRTALNGIRAEIDLMRVSGVTEQEKENAVNSLWGSMLIRNLTRANQAYYMALYEYLGVGYQYWDHFIDDLRKVNPQEVRLTAEKYLPYKDYVLSTVGKK